VATPRRQLDPPIPPRTQIRVVLRNDSSAAAYSFSQWLAAASNRTWAGGVNKTLPGFPGAAIVSGGSAVTDYIKKTPFSIGCAAFAR
jgi:ABC-type phosphate transport system substrate-binding protein